MSPPRPPQRRSRVVRAAYPAPASPPGTLADTGAPRPGSVTVRVSHYGPGALVQSTLVDPTPADIHALAPEGQVLWVDVQGTSDVGLLTALGERFGLYTLALEDVVAGAVRPKQYSYPGHVFIVGRRPAARSHGVVSDQVSLFLLHDAVVSLHNVPEDIFAPVRERLTRPQGNLRRSGADYLAYALIDALVDEYYPVLEGIGEGLERLEAKVLDEPDSSVVGDIRSVKDDLLALRRGIWPLREVIASLQSDPGDAFGADTAPFLRNCYDHIVEVLEIVEIYREVAAGLTDMYLASVNNRMSEVMKVLTLMATIFIPLTFIAGVYGMNFDRGAGRFSMPELGWAWGYPVALGLMTVIAVALILYFRRKGWL